MLRIQLLARIAMPMLFLCVLPHALTTNSSESENKCNLSEFYTLDLSKIFLACSASIHKLFHKESCLLKLLRVGHNYKSL